MARRARHRETRDGFYQRNDSPIWWTTVGGRRVSTRCRDLDAARAWRADQERRAVDPGYAAARTLTLRKAVTEFLEHLESHKRSDGTMDFYGRKLGHVLGHMGEETPAAAVTPMRVQQYVAARLRVVSAATVRKEVQSLASLARWLWRTERWPYHPDKLIPDRLGGEYVPRSRFLTRAEFDALLAVLRPVEAAWVCAAVATGGRLGEVNRLRRGDVDMDAGIVRVRVTKTRKTEGDIRTIPVLAMTRPFLERALRDGAGKDGALVRHWPSSYASRVLGAACERAGIVRVSATDLRRTLASWLRQAGVPVGMVAHMLGHTSDQMVARVYGQLTPDAVRNIIEAACTQGVPTGQV